MNAPTAPLELPDAIARQVVGPPRLPFVFSVGITGHRLDALGDSDAGSLEERIRQALSMVLDAARAVHQRERESFADGIPRFRFVSPLADGADQIAAEAALAIGFELQAILPFPCETYRATFPDERSRAAFETLLSAATCVLELPGEPGRQLDAYVMAGRATIAHSDVLLAVWDGLPPRGRGGTGEVVELALKRGTPVLHMPVAAADPPLLWWSAFDPHVVTERIAEATKRPLDETQLDKLVTALAGPPPDSRERDFLLQFHREHDRRWRPRIEYPLLLAATGISSFNRHAWRGDHCSAATRAEWRSYGEQCVGCHGVSAPLSLLEQWYDWADRLAGHFAQSYRSGHVFNFLLGAIAVLIALSALVLPKLKPYLASVELLVILAILLNTRVGVKQQWHRRWLDYRQLAERLRPMRSLKLLGIASPDPPGSVTNPIADRWIEWFAAGAWRAIGCPSGAIPAAKAAALTRAISTHELRPQIAYHRSAARQAHRLDHRLELFGTGLFAATLLSCVALLVMLVADPDWVSHNFKWFTIASAGLPALGTAMLGIRVHGDFAGGAVRSESTANVLEAIGDEMDQAGSDLSRAADLTEQAARAMFGDLDEWRLVNQQHDLSV